MSKLSYSINRAIEELEEMEEKKKSNAIVKVFRIAIYFFKDLWYDYPYVWLRNLNNIITNIKFFWPHISTYRDFDSSYSIDLFCDSLEHLSKGLKRHDHCVLSERNARRCLRAAKQLRKAYAYQSYHDKSYQSLAKNNPFKFNKLDNGYSTMTHEYSVSEEYYTKMFEIVRKRTKNIEQDNKKEAWLYIHKHIQHWWD